MAARRANPRVVKLHRSYSVSELAACFGVHKNTVRHWQRDGLKPIDGRRPVLFQGAIVRAFLMARNASRKCPCPPGTFFCFRCREPRPPALGMAEFTLRNRTTGNLIALCETCGTVMNRSARLASLGAVLPKIDVQIREAGARLIERTPPSLNCDKRKG
ncbi:MAG: helix-turn-helix domain-containing protein [Sphingomicrobium sp.]